MIIYLYDCNSTVISCLYNSFNQFKGHLSFAFFFLLGGGGTGGVLQQYFN